MSQQTVAQEKSWAVVSVLKEDADDQQLKEIASEVSTIIDEWQSKGKFMLSGPFDDNKTALTVFHGTEDEISMFHEQYKKATSSVLNTFVYQWDAFPVLSIL
ncbi:MAG TPA: hypothetical protein VFM64_00580 [Candidatus Nitrosotenuis sp.]|nr:hypothetical protein [Candidatus Nitrosotenuis sp.]